MGITLRTLLVMLVATAVSASGHILARANGNGGHHCIEIYQQCDPSITRPGAGGCCSPNVCKLKITGIESSGYNCYAP
ncbi:hypothetical protein BST61_g9161 [Cercospora zeina]